MGAIKKSEVNSFAAKVLKALDLGAWTMQWTSAGPSFCARECKTILIHKSYIGRYPWEAKEVVLHEIAHIFSTDDRHGEGFYRKYIWLLRRFMVAKPL